ncbi:MAG: ABC transporter permease [Hungatella sp.]
MSIANKDLVMTDYKIWSQKRRKELCTYYALSFIGIFTFFAIWQITVMTGIADANLLPSPVTVFQTIITKFQYPEPDGNTMMVNIMASLKVALSGFLLAIIIGVPLGLVMGWFRIAESFFRPIFELVRPIPPIAWIPLIVVWFGIGLPAKALIIFFSAFVPCVINAYTGIQLTNHTYINVAKTFGASETEIFYKIGVPSSLPMVFAGIRVALGNSWSTLVAAEMLAATAGLGYMIQFGRTIARPDLVVAGMVVIGAIGAVLSGILSFVEKNFIKGQKGESY